MSIVEADRLLDPPDVVVVGAGPAGLAVAHGLAGSGVSVVVVESGGLDPMIDRELGRGCTVAICRTSTSPAAGRMA